MKKTVKTKSSEIKGNVDFSTNPPYLYVCSNKGSYSYWLVDHLKEGSIIQFSRKKLTINSSKLASSFSLASEFSFLGRPTLVEEVGSK